MAPLIIEFQKNLNFEVKVAVTAQHREMLDQVLNFFEIVPDFDLDLMKQDQDLFTLTSGIISGLKPVLEKVKPDYVFVHGDTTTAMAASIAAYYSKCKICHIEAGLRTYNKYSPYPEELNRQIISKIADIHFAPTLAAKENLLREGIADSSIIVTGNTVIDALYYGLQKIEDIENEEINFLKKVLDTSRNIILVTGHRRENYGQGMANICEALGNIAKENKDVQLVYPVHLSPNVANVVNKSLSGIENVILIKPLAYPAFIWLMNKSTFIITDSGGIQEEAPSLGKPVIVIRETTERHEAVVAGTVIVAGTDKETIINESKSLLNDKERLYNMSLIQNPYGDGKACGRIVDYIDNDT